MQEFIIKYWLEIFFGIAMSGLGMGFKWLFMQFKAVKLGMQAILRNEIIEQYNKYVERGYIPIYALDNVEIMYNQYHALGGNGTVTHLFEELKELPTKKREEN